MEAESDGCTCNPMSARRVFSDAASEPFPLIEKPPLAAPHFAVPAVTLVASDLPFRASIPARQLLAL